MPIRTAVPLPCAHRRRIRLRRRCGDPGRPEDDARPRRARHERARRRHRTELPRRPGRVGASGGRRTRPVPQRRRRHRRPAVEDRHARLRRPRGDRRRTPRRNRRPRRRRPGRRLQARDALLAAEALDSVRTSCSPPPPSPPRTSTRSPSSPASASPTRAACAGPPRRSSASTALGRDQGRPSAPGRRWTCSPTGVRNTGCAPPARQPPHPRHGLHAGLSHRLRARARDGRAHGRPGREDVRHRRDRGRLPLGGGIGPVDHGWLTRPSSGQTAT